MNDRALLELAAKAAGVNIDKSPSNGGGTNNTGFDIMGNAVLDWFHGKTWNPLTDDGDALRLAVACRMQIDILDRSVYALALGGTKVCELDRADLAAATRRAIVCAAAEIGKNMP